MSSPEFIQYPSAKIILRLPQDNKILLLARTIAGETALEPAGGKVEVNFEKRSSESFEECIIREVREELKIETKVTHYIGSYYFFWSSKNNVCSNCVLFLGDIIAGTVNSVQQEECGQLSLAWATIEQLKQKKIPIRAYHVGLEELLVKAAYILEAQFKSECKTSSAS